MKQYNRPLITALINTVSANHGIGNKNKLAELCKDEFNLTRKGSVYFCDSFAIRFCSSRSQYMGNTVLALSALKKYDDRPFFVCIVTPSENYILLSNTTCLKKISHSSHNLRIDNIRGSFNGSDIMREIEGLDNSPQNFEEIYELHCCFTFDDNLERLVETTNSIVGTRKKFEPTESEYLNILAAPERAKRFIASEHFRKLDTDLKARVDRVANEIAIASRIDNVNIRGRIIEYLIAGESDDLRNELVAALHADALIPAFKTDDGLGYYTKTFDKYITDTDIKTKVLHIDINPKAYNIDKLLEFLSKDDSIYLVFLIGIDKEGKLQTRLCPALESQLLDSTGVVFHWAGRNSRGVTQFYGNGLNSVLNSDTTEIDEEKASSFLQKLLDL